ncbi:MAG TPA: murein biosynthesis integral membrane protein MurJ [Desulfobacteraceae bacterium]|nr:murein biosynthesis integral membrane protein MurJ [Desulfobacteraceae bacterium]HPJ68918.1 murein biosynthesis integral membrane protein MurJ [Desulfobacteraceae bacterium]HPQ29236.1 murein biosynthesis integral membrane protein MurJ [Desulfobacteraceae bacterium]
MATSDDNKITRSAGVVSFYTFLSRILGLIRDMVIASLFGSSMAADAFFVAFRIPNLLRRLFAEGSLTISFIPIFTEYLNIKGREDAFNLARIVLTLLSVILAVISILGVIFSPWIVRIQAFGFGTSSIKYDLTVLLTRITFPYIFLISIVAFFMGVLNSLRHFAAPAAAPIFLNLGIIGAAYFISPYCDQPIVGIAIGVLIGGFMQICLQIPWVIKEGIRLFPKWQLDHPALKKMGLLMVPAIFGSAVYQFNQFIGTLLASFLEEGSISWLYYADRLVQFPLGIFAIAISTAALPSLSTHIVKKDYKQYGDTLSYALSMVFFITLPSMVGLIVLGRPIISIIFERGAFDAYCSLMTSQALLFYSIGLWAFSGIRVIVSGFYAIQDTVTPVKVAVIALGTNLILSLVLMAPMKHSGLAFALSLSSAVQFFLLILFLKKKVHVGNIKYVFVSGIKFAFAAAVMGLGVKYFNSKWLVMDSGLGLWILVIKLTTLIIIGLVIYFSVVKMLGCQEVTSIMNLFKARKKGYKI